MKPSVLVLLEPALENSTYESKYLPLMMKYLNSDSITINVIGSSNSVNVIKKKFKSVYSIPVYPKGSHGVGLFLGYLSYLALSFLALIRISQKQKCSVLVSLGGHPYTGLVVSTAAKICKKKSIVRISEPTRIIIRDRYTLGRLLFNFVRCAEFLSFCCSDLIIANRDMCWYHPLIRPKQVILSQGVDVSRFNRNAGIAFPTNMFPVLITVGRLDKQKNIKSVIEAIDLLRGKYPKIYYLIVGSGPDEKELRDRAKQLRIDMYINFYSYASPEKIPSLLNSANFFVLPSLVEGLPSAVLEAMACGLPVILASTNYSCQESFKNEENALIISGHSESIAEAIDRLVSDNQLRNALIINGQKYVRAYHDSSETNKYFTEAVKRLTNPSMI
jgi:glycosyltransferase involved in cell wall biosynthesis